MRTVVDVPVEYAFSYLADIRNRGEWAAEVVRVENTSPGSIGVGSTYTVWIRLRVWPFGSSEVSSNHEVTDFVPNRRIVWEVEATGSRIRAFCEVEPANGGTRIILVNEWARVSPLLLPVMPLLYVVRLLCRPFIRRQESRMLQRLKQRLESA